MSSYNKVAVLGKGLLGAAVLEELITAGFNVTLLSRDPSKVKDLPAGVKTAQVDYSSEDSVVEALRGQDVAVATFGSEAIITQDKIIDAAIKAGVKRYIPADWGSVTTDPKAKTLPFNYPVVKIQDYLKKKAEEGALEWTIFSVGAFLEYVLNLPFLIDLRSKSVQLYDEGQHTFSSTSVHSVGKAIAGALKKPEATKNRNLLIHDIVLSQAKVLALAKKHSPPGTQWTETRIDAAKEFEQSLENLKKDPTDFHLVLPLLKATILGGNYRAAFTDVDNELVGLPLLTDEEFERKLESTLRNL
ncbi:hypothetical protein NM208_g8893 [Fusarium decemcellulare]|uniref:Uncharacterized protein n=1 Tax=Fusarium decemcellulare TaxID=57161 RepID=A0ACC1S3M4_9HYPO|nr:hypothetical protein NM208_g8893 [Fusarium decemcellulare]